ncbi:MAG: abortive infection family protein [Phycisphaera sp.]|nr:MAG: abortive infection family protein [Phycisphaera sp.]
MADRLTAQSFQMHGARHAFADGPFVEPIEQQLAAIEQSIVSVPDFAFDLSKTLVESVCKTILADIGQPADPNWDCPRLLKETTNRLSLLPAEYPNPAKPRESIEKTLRGLLQTIQGLCELRNNFGMASHGRDGHGRRLDLRQATLAAQAADTIAAFIYRMHRDSASRSPGARVYYEDHSEFNTWLDEENELIDIGTVTLQPSRVLFHMDVEAYKTAVNDYLADKQGTGEKGQSSTNSTEDAP